MMKDGGYPRAFKRRLDRGGGTTSASTDLMTNQRPWQHGSPSRAPHAPLNFGADGIWMQVRSAPRPCQGVPISFQHEDKNGAPATQTPKQLLVAMAHPTRFERVASAFGGITGSSVEITKEREAIHYHTANKKEFETSFSRDYPSTRYDFRPAAYVVLTRDGAVRAEEYHG